MLSATAAKTAIKDKMAAVLPALLTGAGLDDLSSYLDKQPADREVTTLGLYTESESDSTDNRTLSIIMQIQLPRIGDWKQEYHSVIFQAVRENITAGLIDYTIRESIDADIYPVDKNGSSFIFYVLTFSSPLDDCEEE